MVATTGLAARSAGGASSGAVAASLLPQGRFDLCIERHMCGANAAIDVNRSGTVVGLLEVGPGEHLGRS